MIHTLRSTAAAFALILGGGFALAQQPSPPPQAQPGSSAQQPASSTEQPGNLQTPQAERGQEKATHTESGKAGKEEPSSHAPSAKPMDTAVFVNGSLAVPGAAKETQTTPAKYSQRNAELDELSIAAARPRS